MTVGAATEDIAEVIIDLAQRHNATPGQWASLEWRLDNLYWVVDKHGKTARFVMNPQQRAFIRRLWWRNLILKARQLGFSTLMLIVQLDQAWWHSNFNGVVIADTLPNASKLFGKVEFAYARLPQVLREAYPVARREVGSMLVIQHLDADGLPAHSTISVSVSSRGGTVQLLHVSELGKIALKFPQRAEEIKTGALPSAEQGVIVIESTAEGAFGLYWELCEPAIKRWHDGTPETRKDYRLHFFPWFDAPEYALSDADTAIVQIPPKLTSYFRKLEVELGVTLTPNQRAWYAKEQEIQKGKMKQEYPSTPEEAFEQAIEGAVYGEQMTWLRENDRMGIVALDPAYPVDTVWDFGLRDMTAIWFHQQIGIQHRWFYYYERNGKGLRWWWREFLEQHRHRHHYAWGKHVLPHDADAEILGEVPTTKRRILESMGMGSGDGGSIIVVPRVATLDQGIEITRAALMGGNHWFDKRIPDETKGEDMGAGLGLKCMDGYQYRWDDKQGVWSREPLHNWASHGADAWRQYAQAPAEVLLGAAGGRFKAFTNRPRRGI